MEKRSHPLELVAGPLNLVFEPGTGMLRYVRLGDVEVIRGVYIAVRDRNWETIAPAVSKLSVEQRSDAFAVSFEVACVRNEIDFRWRGHLRGESDGTIEYRMEGEARSTFLRNRIGFCVLHPIRECAGRPCIVRHVDGTTTEGRFPREISPHQPFQQIAAIRHPVTGAVDCEVTFAGDVFEMEDQRNWTDASYKTYCTPLELPFPVEVRSGGRIAQSVKLSLIPRAGRGLSPIGEPSPSRRDPVLVEHLGHRLPPLGLCVASQGEMPSSRELTRMGALHLSHLRVDIRAGDAVSVAGLDIAARQAGTLDVPLDLGLTLSTRADEELLRLREQLARLQTRISHCFVFHEMEKSTSARWVTLARERLADLAGDAKFAGGTNAYFAELNRGRPETAAMDAVVYSINPQVHAGDDASLVETLAAQGDTVRSAERFCGGKPICVGPITLRPRFNPNATGAAAPLGPGELPPDVDVRQGSLFAAAWTLGSISELSMAGAARLAYFETAGWRGVMETEAGSPRPEAFPSVGGGVYPVYHVLADVGEFAGAEIARLGFERPLEIRGALLRRMSPTGGARCRLLVANVSSRVQRVPLPPPAEFGGACFWYRWMDEGNVDSAVREPERFREQAAVVLTDSIVELRPYAYACLDVVGGSKP